MVCASLSLLGSGFMGATNSSEPESGAVDITSSDQFLDTLRLEVDERTGEFTFVSSPSNLGGRRGREERGGEGERGGEAEERDQGGGEVEGAMEVEDERQEQEEGEEEEEEENNEDTDSDGEGGTAGTRLSTLQVLARLLGQRSVSQ